jgi:hypothetical protein
MAATNSQLTAIQSQSQLTAGGLPPTSSSWRQASLTGKLLLAFADTFVLGSESHLILLSDGSGSFQSPIDSDADSSSLWKSESRYDRQ